MWKHKLATGFILKKMDIHNILMEKKETTMCYIEKVETIKYVGKIYLYFWKLPYYSSKCLILILHDFIAL